VAKGFSQREGIDYHELFSLVVKHKTIRVLLAIIYMSQPEGFLVSGKEDRVCLLKRSLYGLKQSLRQWYKRFDAFMVSHDFVRNEYDNCVYPRKLLDGSFIYLLLYVDDMLIAAKNKAKIDSLKALLSNEFEMKNLGAAKKDVGYRDLERQEGMTVICFSTEVH